MTPFMQMHNNNNAHCYWLKMTSFDYKYQNALRQDIVFSIQSMRTSFGLRRRSGTTWNVSIFALVESCKNLCSNEGLTLETSANLIFTALNISKSTLR